MDIAPTLVRELAHRGIAYDIVHHHRSNSSLNTAHSAHIPAHKLVKSVILEDESGYLMALIPANQHIRVQQLNLQLNREMGLAAEQELSALFTDCDPGAIPPVGPAYGMEMVVDEDLDACEDVYIEAGNHTDLLHLSGKAFHKLTADHTHAAICEH